MPPNKIHFTHAKRHSLKNKDQNVAGQNDILIINSWSPTLITTSVTQELMIT
jgi:hypothetical protein